jgi:hypothetical protein
VVPAVAAALALLLLRFSELLTAEAAVRFGMHHILLAATCHNSNCTTTAIVLQQQQYYCY